jgi:plasmid stabilization system protein ParE
MEHSEEEVEKAFRVRLSVNATQNINEITGYIAFVKQSPLNAIKVGDAIYRVIERIARQPFAFKECEELATKTKIYRGAVCLSWLVIYKVVSDQILILGIIHSARKPSVLKSLRKIR